MAVDFFLKLGDIKGESQDHKHKDEMQLDSWSWGMTQTGSHAGGGGGGSGKVSVHDFNFTKRADTASPIVMGACCTGTHIAKAVLTCRKAGEDQQEFLTITFSDLLVSSFQTSGSGGGDDLPVDNVSLNFSKHEVDYKGQDAKGKLTGSVKSGWDQKANKKV